MIIYTVKYKMWFTPNHPCDYAGGEFELKIKFENYKELIDSPEKFFEEYLNKVNENRQKVEIISVFSEDTDGMMTISKMKEEIERIDKWQKEYPEITSIFKKQYNKNFYPNESAISCDEGENNER